jgi:hypothetical protein
MEAWVVERDVHAVRIVLGTGAGKEAFMTGGLSALG